MTVDHTESTPQLKMIRAYYQKIVNEIDSELHKREEEEIYRQAEDQYDSDKEAGLI